MTVEEFSNQFDVLLDSFGRANFPEETVGNIALDEYEKSVYLTRAQEALVLSYYNGSSVGESFEETEEVRRYLANLVETSVLKPIDLRTGISSDGSHTYFTLPSDLWFITHESATTDSSCAAFKSIDVYPVTQDDYDKTKRNPYRGANDRRALRLDLADGVIEVVSTYHLSDYTVRYLRKPKPIILTDLGDITIDGESQTSDYGDGHSACELHTALHEKILEVAVLTALQNKTKTFNSKS
jgi:hypothetical protein